MVTNDQRDKLLSATRQLASLMQEYGVMNLDYLFGMSQESRILMVSLTRALPAQSCFVLSAPGWCDRLNLPPATPARQSWPDSTSGDSASSIAPDPRDTL